MAVFRWKGGSVGLDQGRYEVASDWTDLSTGTSGVSAPASGDTTYIAGIRDAGISRLGALYLFPVDSVYTQVLFYAPPTAYELQSNPNGIVGYTVQNQALNIQGVYGPASLWLQNSHLVADRINVAGTAVVSSYLDSSISGSIAIGVAGVAGFLQIETIAADTSLIAPTDHVPVTTLDAVVTIGLGSTLDVEASAAVTGIINNGTIDVTPGGTLIVDDVDDRMAVADVNKDEVDFPFNNDMLLGNGGTISIQGAAGRTTQAVIIADTVGPGAIVVDGNGALETATSLVVDGYMTNQAITLADGTVRFNDAQTAVGNPGLSGFDVTGGSFTFADGHGTLILNQAALTTLTLHNGSASQEPDGRMPFTTPVSGFGQGDAIAFVGKYQAGLGLTYQTVFDAGTDVLKIESVDGANSAPAVYAQLQLVGTYDPALFVLTGNASTDLLTLTYTGPEAARPSGTAALRAIPAGTDAVSGDQGLAAGAGSRGLPAGDVFAPAAGHGLPADAWTSFLAAWSHGEEAGHAVAGGPYGPAPVAAVDFGGQAYTGRGVPGDVAHWVHALR